ncbi:CDP-diacylglycerol--glycerol-3-phosphate 3-phosphatidyltransferase [Caldanaerobius fijiensis DSM 17918]|uniref:CDP-diacylglycerol--glycerol-3-phosphate 3-phosphatidyltransferase n=2 Tax=Caldanaerobius TaxID=862261 RepID=A0A1M4STW9_9THEO|nr:CDP-diacylglycerol--glycerol-3-phosphate 3-phosphatidyltransferase [Caldanaerobius fijiensis DSM 17918]
MMLKYIPNILTTFRIILVPVYLAVFFFSAHNNMFYALLIFLLAGFTDVADGIIARKYGFITKFGTLVDPLADKLMLIAVLFSLTIKKLIPLPVLSIVIIKETIMIIGAAFLYNKNKIAISADKFGKIATVVFYIAVIAVVIKLPYAAYIMALAIFMTILALINYAIKFKMIIK